MRLRMGDALLILDCRISRINYGGCCLYTDIAGFTKIMTIVATNVHYGI